MVKAKRQRDSVSRVSAYAKRDAY